MFSPINFSLKQAKVAGDHDQADGSGQVAYRSDERKGHIRRVEATRVAYEGDKNTADRDDRYDDDA